MTKTTSFRISDELRDVYYTNRCCWNVATYKWNVNNGKIEIISFVESFFLKRPSLSISRCRKRHEADLAGKWERYDQQHH
jgi:hypothetical protein